MSRVRFHSTVCRTIAALSIYLGTIQMLRAAGESPSAPASFVQDDARLFEATAIERMSRALVEFHQSTGVSVYVATTTYQEAAAIRHHAQQLTEQWLHDKPGVMLTYNRGSGQTGIVASPELWRQYAADEIAQMLTDTSRTLSQPGAGPEHRIQEAVSLAADHIRQWDANRAMQTAVFTGVERRLATMLGATIALSTLTIFLVTRLRRRKVAAQGGPYFFPEATTQSRLGGQYGGGSIGESAAPRRD